MNGYELCARAYTRLGLGNEDCFRPENNTSQRDLEFLNQILQDLKLESVTELSCEIKCSENKAEAICCGVAMLVSFCEGETEKNQFYTSLYNAKRAAILSSTEKIEDTIPVAESGGV